MNARRSWALAALALVVAAAAILVLVFHVPNPGISPLLAQRLGRMREHGKYVAVLGDCAACHTAAGGQPFAGGVPFSTPVGTVYSTNITPDRNSGIGNYSFEDFVRVMRLGVTPDGTRLYPAMPYTAYAKVSDEDLQDLFAYLQSGLAPAHEARRASAIPWPLSIRWPLALWNLAFHDNSRFVADGSKDGAVETVGAYLVQGLTHCGTCHTPRGIAFEEADVTRKSDLYLSGIDFDAGPRRSTCAATLATRLRGAGAPSDDAICRELLKSGPQPPFGRGPAPWPTWCSDGTQYMTEQDVVAIATIISSPFRRGSRRTVARHSRQMTRRSARSWPEMNGQPEGASTRTVALALSRWRRRNAMGPQLLKFQAAVTASRHVLIAAARNVRCVGAEVRWRWTSKVLQTAALAERNLCAEPKLFKRCILRSRRRVG